MYGSQHKKFKKQRKQILSSHTVQENAKKNPKTSLSSAEGGRLTRKTSTVTLEVKNSWVSMSNRPHIVRILTPQVENFHNSFFPWF